MEAREGYRAWQSALWPVGHLLNKGGKLSPSPLWGGVGEGSLPNATPMSWKCEDKEFHAFSLLSASAGNVSPTLEIPV